MKRYLAMLVIPLFFVGTSSVWAMDFGVRNATMWEYEQWSVDNPSWSGNAFDVVATVTATHTSSGTQKVFDMFFDGDTTWKFRFTGDRVGEWTFTTFSTDAELNGHTGVIDVAAGAPDALGFNTALGKKYVWQYGNDGAVKAQVRRVYTDARGWMWKDESPSEDLTDYFKPQLDDAMSLGFDAVWITIRHNWFKWGAWTASEHVGMVDPDLTVFRMLEKHIMECHRRALSLDVRVWGDHAHDRSAESLPGGTNGAVDQRLQRYLAARLGALPGWSLSYAYDLEEWMNNSKCDTWADYLNERLAWPHLVWTRRYYNGISVTVASNDDRPLLSNYPGGVYQNAVDRLEENANGNRPVLFERNFNRNRNGVWTDDNTRKAMWAFAMAGGVSAHWQSEKYQPEWQNQAQLLTFGKFWVDNNRFLVDMEQSNAMSGNGAWVLFSPQHQALVAYKENTSSIQLDLTTVSGTLKAIAVDTRSSFAELDLGTLNAAGQTVTLPYASDWAIAIGDFTTEDNETIGDVTCDGVVDHVDAIGALKTLANSGDDLPICSPSGANVDGDARFGLAEAIHALGAAGQ